MTAEPPLPVGVLDALRAYDTPTICNALELVAPERRLTGFTVRPLVCPFPDRPPMVGYARTATIRATAPAGDAQAARALRLAYYDYVGTGPAPRISVIQDLDGPEAGTGAFWGEVHSAVHRALGCEGVVTDGSVRDLDQWAPGFRALAGSIGPSHAHVHLVDFGGTVRVAGMTVTSGDLIHADRHGAVVIPATLAARIPAAVELGARREAVILDIARSAEFSLARLKEAIARADDIH